MVWWPCCNINIKINFQLTISLSMSALIFFFFYSCSSLKLWVKKNWFIICTCCCKNLKYWSQDEQISKFCVFVSKMRCSFKIKRPCTYKGRLLFWVHCGRRHPEQRHGDPDTFLPKCRIWYLRNRGRLISLSSQVRLL